MKIRTISFFEGLSVCQKIEALLLLLVAFLIPMSWRFSVLAMILWLVMALVRTFVDRKYKALVSYPKRKLFFLFFVCFYLMYCVSMIYTQNTAEGVSSLEKKLLFLLLPLAFLVVDFSYITAERMKKVLYIFVISIFSVFCYDIFSALVDFITKDCGIGRFFSEQLSPQHHAYLSMYVCLAIVFCFYETFQNWKLNTKTKSILLIVLILAFTVYIFLLSSRAGLLCMILLYAVLLCWLIFSKKMYKLGVTVATIAIVGVVVSFLAFPQATNRIVNTAKSVVSEEKQEDIRVTILRSTLIVAKENWLLGVGVGDRCDAYMQQYQKNGAQNVYNHNFNSHNQYVDTLTSVGIVGLLLLLSFVAVPVILAAKDKKWNLMFMCFLVIIYFNALFESIFERQSGIVFFMFFFALFFNQTIKIPSKTAKKIDTTP